jgi:hypothetical protein
LIHSSGLVCRSIEYKYHNVISFHIVEQYLCIRQSRRSTAAPPSSTTVPPQWVIDLSCQIVRQHLQKSIDVYNTSLLALKTFLALCQPFMILWTLLNILHTKFITSIHRFHRAPSHQQSTCSYLKFSQSRP